MKPRIVCAANRLNERIILGIRHWDDFMRQQVTKDYELYEQGFVDQFGTFYTRTEAFQLAAKNHQIIRLCGNPTSNKLYSENLY